MYYSDSDPNDHLKFDCLYAHAIETEIHEHRPSVITKQFSLYCRRPDTQQEEMPLIQNENVMRKVTFDELKQQDVTSEQLLEWSAPMDIAERYEMNSQSSEIFYNCSSPWFGSKCQYRFLFNSSLSFSDIVQVFANSRLKSSLDISVTTCYPFIAGCNRGPWSLCLDWRQICNGVSDCMNGEDERGCEVLEMTVCNEDEYRCHYGGQCIQRAFFRDGVQGTECLDGSDAEELPQWNYLVRNAACGSVTTFRCDERINQYPRAFSCGDGEFLYENDLPSGREHCWNGRDREVTLTMLTSFDHIKDTKCRSAFRCLLLTDRQYGVNVSTDFSADPVCFEVTWDTNCASLAESCLDEWLVLPEYPTLYGYFQFVYFTNRSNEDFEINVVPDLVCFDDRKCPFLKSKVTQAASINGLTCCHSYDLIEVQSVQHFRDLHRFFRNLYHRCAKAGDETTCLNTSYFFCNESLKCISYNRVGDGFEDCLYGEDESFPLCRLNISNAFQCPSDTDKCLLPVAIGNGYGNCPDKEDESPEIIYGLEKKFPFPFICNRVINLRQSDFNRTDEVNCDLWPCNNPYSQCNGIWDCFNGIDELNCPNVSCSVNEFPCKNEQSNMEYCLPFGNMFHLRRSNCQYDPFIRRLYFYNGTNATDSHYYSFNNSLCINEENICESYFRMTMEHTGVCLRGRESDLTVLSASEVHFIDINNTYICKLQTYKRFPTIDLGPYLTSARLGYYPDQETAPVVVSKSNSYHKQLQLDLIPLYPLFLPYCHYGVSARLNDVSQKSVCFCPPNYFGSQCQWQNQRISLTLQSKIYDILNVPTAFQLVITLIDDAGHIMPNHEQLMYMPAHECDTKFNIYLLYPDRPKNSSVNYSIRIDLFDKSTLTYWNSWYLPIPFQFLPVNRVASQLIISQTQRQQPCTLSCGEHGRCTTYSNTDTKQFCRCDQGYSGPSCNESYRCECSNDSYCLSRSICVCPLNKFGSRCYLKRSICESAKNPCENGGICVAQDDRLGLNIFICVCPQGYHGDQCQYKSNRIDVIVDDRITSVSSSFLLYFIEALSVYTNYFRTTTMKEIPFGHHSMTISFPKPFNILFVQIPDGDYYLAVRRERFIPSEHIRTRISTNNRCFRIRELLNDTFYNFEYLRRVKYYPLLCRQNPSLMCFYDNQLMCICDSDRFSNCFDLNPVKKQDCNGQNICHNGGECFMDLEKCSRTFICICTDCYYGRQCNFTTRGFIFSLDPILGYHIKPNVTIYRQPPIIKFSIGLTLIMLVSELIMGSLSIITFLGKKSREVGCGYYLLASSVSSMCMMLILTYKFWQLVLSQMAVITSRSFLQFNCVSIEIVLRSCLATSEWLHACVAIERMFGVVKGVRFDKRQSRQAAKGTIVVVIVCCVATHLHDPIHRELVDDLDGDQQRTWCLTQYSDIVHRYNSFITFFHFLTPFSINLMSTLILIIQAARVRFQVDRNSQQSWFGHFQTKLKQHRHILLSPVILLLLGIPRLIISFSLGCMRSPRQSWLFLIGYFLSFVPSILILFIFILPSNVYKNELKELVRGLMRQFCGP